MSDLRVFFEHPEVLQECAQNLYEHHNRDGDWAALSVEEQGVWRERVIEEAREFATLTSEEQAEHNRRALERDMTNNDKRYEKLMRDRATKVPE